MKSFAAATLFVAAAYAQGLTDLPECGQTCIQSMLGQAESLGCDSADAECLCSKMDFGFGVRDCSAQACPADADLSSIEQYAVSYCGDVDPTAAGVAVTQTPAVTDPSMTMETEDSTMEGGMVMTVTGEDGEVMTTTMMSDMAEVTDTEMVTETNTEINTETETDTEMVTETETATETETDTNAVEAATDSAGSALSDVTDSAGSAVASATGGSEEEDPNQSEEDPNQTEEDPNQTEEDPSESTDAEGGEDNGASSPVVAMSGVAGLAGLVILMAL